MSNVELTDSQREAVECTEGPLLVVAGPGSGKTRVITHRIARLVDNGVKPWRILAITFTNKAANEMAERTNQMLESCHVWVTTFHKFCARILRQYGKGVGLEANFTIYDVRDQRDLIKRAMENLEFDSVAFKPAKIGHQISRAKNELIGPENFSARYESSIGDATQAVAAEVYPEYQRLLLEANAVDFDDLLLHVVTLMADNPELRSKLDHQYEYVLVDEYQDTNTAQYKIISGLSRECPNLCVTGDPDQSIYGWRGARIQNILRFEQDHPRTRVVRLEENFRSTPNILAVADRLIAHNVRRKAKTLIPTRSAGRDVEVRQFASAFGEADHLAGFIRDEVKSGRREFNDFAVFYRVNALSRLVELALLRAKIPYQMAAGVEFYQRKEIKDLLAFLRLVANPKDYAAFARIANTLLKAVGKISIQRLLDHADRQQIDLVEACRTAGPIPKINKPAAKSFREFSTCLANAGDASVNGVTATLRSLIDSTGFTDEWESDESEDSIQRLANVGELINAAAEYDRSEEQPTLDGFLEMACLVNEGDNLDETGSVKMMTLHAAKGLEFPVVAIIGLEEGLLPHERALGDFDNGNGLEEERRLLFVGITRAREELLLTNTLSRQVYGRNKRSIDSLFVRELGLQVQDFTGSGVPTWAALGFGGFDSPQSQSANTTGRQSVAKPGGFNLTTAAQMANGTTESVTLPQGFAVGSRVRHPQYGRGVVVGCGGYSKNRTVTVEFNQGQKETFVVSKAPLEPIGMG
ncbi:MAG: UvrD-helicase domain-containing protein [Planctomycetota bacterium]|nr:UvrD-helicase domain-containing protein [Planctomycetota bacterium]